MLLLFSFPWLAAGDPVPLALSTSLAVCISSFSAGGEGKGVDGGVGEGVAGGLGEVAVGVEGVVDSGVFVSGILSCWSALLWPG